MSGKLPIDRVREAQDAPAIYDEHRERFAEKQAKLQQTDQVEEGEGPPAAEEHRPSDTQDATDEDRA